MTPTQWQQVKGLLAAALEEPPARRNEFLDERCAGDPDLRREVESLLEHASEPVNSAPTTSSITTVDLPEPRAPYVNGGRVGRIVGPYRLERILGEGGMGSVHLAFREVDGFSMRVAFKIMRVAAVSDYSLRRFRMERQILARLTHPNITRLLDGGVTNEGLPYLVTEYIEGLPLDQYCAQHKPTLGQRLEVFLDICAALSFAHRNLIVHGDIKPANILVTPEGTAKLVDFGIARLVDPEIEATGLTTTFALTPGWASPEQLRGEPPSVLSDLYSVGRLFYELIAGQPSHKFTGLPPQRYLEVLGQTPQLPSVVSGSRNLAGDLDDIAIKAVEFEPDQRYQSADQFAEDIRAYIESRPISARKTTWRYRAAKFTRRHRRGVIIGGAMAATLISLLAVAIWQARTAREHYATAARQAQAVRKLANSFIFDLDDAVAEMPGATKIRFQIMQNAVAYLDRQGGESARDIELQEELGLAYTKVGDVMGRPGSANLGKTAEALESYRKAQRILEYLTQQSGATSDQKFHLAVLYSRISALLKVKGDVRTALDFDLKGLAIRQQLVHEAPADRELQRAVAESQTSLGGTYSQLGDWKRVLETRRQALTLYQQLVAGDKKNLSDRRGLVLARTRFASILNHEGRHAPALEQLRTAVAEQKALVDENPANSQISAAYGSTLSALARGLDEAGDPAAAIVQYESAQAIYERLVSLDAVDVRARSLLATARVAVGKLLTRSGKAAAALPRLEHALQTRLYLAERDPVNAGAMGEVADSHSALGDAYVSLRRLSAAKTSYGKAKEILERLARDDRTNAADQTLLAHVNTEWARLSKVNSRSGR